MLSYPWAEFGLNLGVSAIAIVLFVAIIMTVAIRIRNHWICLLGGHVLVAFVSYLMSVDTSADAIRRLVVLSLTTVWGLRLGVYIGHRNRGHGEDKRYTALMKSRSGSLVGFVVRKIYGLQGLLMWVISLPIQFAMYQQQPLGSLGHVAIVLWVIGFAFETIGDWQLSRFKADPASSGRIMDRGLWGWSRHPNYFGESCVWVALFLLSLGTPWGVITIISPIVLVNLLFRYSGKALLETHAANPRVCVRRLCRAHERILPRPPRKALFS